MAMHINHPADSFEFYAEAWLRASDAEFFISESTDPLAIALWKIKFGDAKEAADASPWSGALSPIGGDHDEWIFVACPDYDPKREIDTDGNPIIFLGPDIDAIATGKADLVRKTREAGDIQSPDFSGVIDVVPKNDERQGQIEALRIASGAYLAAQRDYYGEAIAPRFLKLSESY